MEKFTKLDALTPDDGSPVFSASRSAVQGFSPAVKEQQAGQDGPVFSESTHETHGIFDRFKNMVKKENLTSTIMGLGFIKGWADKTLGTWGMPAPAIIAGKPGLLSHLPGVAKVDEFFYGKGIDKKQLTFKGNPKPQGALQNIMAISITSALVQNLAFMMTKRGGEFPEGKNMWEKAVNSIKHPDKHSVHFSNATMSALLGVMSSTRLLLGLQGMNRMRQGDASQDAKANTMKVVAGIAGLICTPMVFVGMFKMKDEKKPENTEEKPQEMKSFAETHAEKADKKGGFIRSFSPKHMSQMASYAMKHDPMGVIGRGLSLVVELGFIAEGRSALQKAPTNGAAYKSVQGGLTGIALSILQAHFVYDRLLANSKDGAAASR